MCHHHHLKVIHDITELQNATSTPTANRIAKCYLHSDIYWPIIVDNVRTWRPNHSDSTPSCSPNSAGDACEPYLPVFHVTTTLNLTTLNCWGLKSGEPCVQLLAESVCVIIALSEHWLWSSGPIVYAPNFYCWSKDRWKMHWEFNSYNRLWG